ncbi:MAG: peptidoglycan editing factor PgeF [Bryobacteraceae bacterium]|nr:peptidoglycan editing factor PgeF [Bryobacteraceae bacterium]
MSFEVTGGVYRSALLSQFPWLHHGFGGRDAADWPPVHHAAVVQVHGSRVVTASEPGSQGDADALVTATPGLYLSVRTADCLPLLMADVRQRRVAAVHAGWRGTVAGIPLAAVQAMGSRPEDVWVAIGPGIGRCCFEVGEEVAREFGRDGRQCIDLFEVNQQKLIDFGVPAGQIAAHAPCTKCTPGAFHSFRRDQAAAGRMHAAIAILQND